MRALQISKDIPRYVITKAVGRIYTPAHWGALANLQYREVPEPVLPGAEWVKIRTRYGGICGSDMNLIFLHDSLSLTALASFPFTLGHENVGFIEQVGDKVEGFVSGERVIAEPLLPCITRGINPPCEYCQGGEYALCQNFTEGSISPGISIGHCSSTGGSWSPYFVAHQSQLFHLPENVNDENAIMIDPFCTALHPVMRNYPDDEDTVLVLGAGVVGICTVAALRMLGSRTRIIVLAKYPFQGEMARKYGADKIIHLQDGDYFQTLADANRGKLFDPVFIKKKVLVGGVDIVYDCVGSARSIDDSLRLARSNGTVVLVGLASIPKKVDWTPIWLNELSVKGSNWCSTEIYNDQRVRTFQIAIDWMAEGLLDLAQLVTHRFELEDYKHALSTTAKRGRNQVIKSVFSFE